jgi:hypothetical protein
MKDLFLIIMFLFAIFNCDAQNQDTVIGAIIKNKPDWIDSWEEYPFKDVKSSQKQKRILHLYHENCCDTLFESECFYIYSPNKKYAVDPYSVRLMTYENEKGETIIGGADPDVGVYLYDLVYKKVYRLLYYGTIEGYDDALWLSDTVFIIFTESNSQPQLIIVDIKNDTYIYHTYKKNTRRFNYIEKKFLQYGIKTD